MKLFFVFLFLFAQSLFSQGTIPTDYFSSPLDIPLILSGSFGELRNNHFHSGLDIKTQQKEGFPVYAPADGYVNRINVQHYGYGKALYILHPNGYSTVYAHLQKFAGNIEDYMKKNQYQKQTFELELFPGADVLPVKKGDLIAFTGNSGSSGGPHLHYEIRDNASRPMNPMLFGVEIPDTKKPFVYSILAYPVGDSAQVNASRNPVKLRLIPQKDGSFKTESITAFGKLGFGIETNDQLNNASNKNGVYQIKSTFNGTEKFLVSFEKFSFAETRYLNRFIDYSYFKANRDKIQKLFREKNNPLSIIKNEDTNGFVEIKEGFSSIYTIEILDFKGNSRIITIPIEGKKMDSLEIKKEDATNDYIFSGQATSITKGKFSIYIPANALYEDTFLNIETEGDVLNFHEDLIPIHQNITITADISEYLPVDREKLFIARLNYKNAPYYNTTTRSGDKLSTKTRTFGRYTIASDSKAPVIKPVGFTDGKWMSDFTALQVRITDDLSGISSYRATVNEKFILMEYDPKTNLLTHDFNDNKLTETENKLKIIVVDNVGNSTTFEATFFRKQS